MHSGPAKKETTSVSFTVLLYHSVCLPMRIPNAICKKTNLFISTQFRSPEYRTLLLFNLNLLLLESLHSKCRKRMVWMPLLRGNRISRAHAHVKSDQSNPFFVRAQWRSAAYQFGSWPAGQLANFHDQEAGRILVCAGKPQVTFCICTEAALFSCRFSNPKDSPKTSGSSPSPRTAPCRPVTTAGKLLEIRKRPKPAVV